MKILVQFFGGQGEAGLDNMRDPGILDPRHFFSPGTFTRFTRFLHDLRDFYMILCDFYTILRDFYTILRDFYAILRDFYTFFAIFTLFFARHKSSAARHLQLFCTPALNSLYVLLR